VRRVNWPGISRPCLLIEDIIVERVNKTSEDSIFLKGKQDEEVQKNAIVFT
jgi:hypothetical protein